jgi:hypothetical protein
MKSSNKNNTIDAIHNLITCNLKNENKNKDKILKEISNEKIRFLKLKTKKKKNLSIDELDEYLNLKDSIKLKTEKFNNINNQNDLINYYLDNTTILSKYYLNKKNIETNK